MKIENEVTVRGSFSGIISEDVDQGLTDYGPPEPDQIDNCDSYHDKAHTILKKTGQAIHGGPEDEVDHMTFYQDAKTGLETVSHIHFKDGREEKRITKKGDTYVARLEIVLGQAIEYNGARYEKFEWKVHDTSGVRHPEMEKESVYRRPTKKYDVNHSLFMAELDIDVDTGKPIGIKYIGKTN